MRALLLLVLAVAACSARRTAIYAAPNLASHVIRTVTIAPLVEERAFPETQVPLATYVQEAAERVLAAKDYETDIAGEAEIANLDVPLLDAEAAELPRLPGRYNLWISTELTETDNTDIGLDTRVRVFGVLVDAVAGEVLWRDRAERESQISGAGFATISPSVRTYEAVYQAVTSLLETLPDRSD